MEGTDKISLLFCHGAQIFLNFQPLIKGSKLFITSNI